MILEIASLPGQGVIRIEERLGRRHVIELTII
jgi:hypothetical protein